MPYNDGWGAPSGKLPANGASKKFGKTPLEAKVFGHLARRNKAEANKAVKKAVNFKGNQDRKKLPPAESKAEVKRESLNFAKYAEGFADLDLAYVGFSKLKGSLAAKGAANPGALAAYIGRKKYGKAGFAALRKGGKARTAALHKANKNLSYLASSIDLAGVANFGGKKAAPFGSKTRKVGAEKAATPTNQDPDHDGDNDWKAKVAAKKAGTWLAKKKAKK